MMPAPPTNPVPVTILTGFLGSGKTTLLNRILQGEHGQRIAVLVNDFGDVNIDARLVASIDGDVIDLSNGCVCCSMRGDLVTSVKRVLTRPDTPQRLVIEASGISNPASIASAFTVTGLRNQTRLDAIIALVDAENARNPRLDQQLVEDQIHVADIIILNKIDLVDGRRPAELRDWIRSIAPDARILDAVQADVPAEVLLDTAPAQQFTPETSGNHEHSVHVRFETRTYRTERPLAYKKVRAALVALPSGIFRAKGFLTLADAPGLRFVAQMVARRVLIDVLGPWGDEPRLTELVFIGEPGAIDEAEIAGRFDACITNALPLLSRESLRVRATPRDTAPGTPFLCG